MPTVDIEGRSVEAGSGETVLDVARRVGVWIPTLCQHEALDEYAACRLCLVEIDRGGWWQVVTACNYPVRGDLTVRVSSERASRSRAGVMRLLLARSPESQELKALARRMGVEGTPWPTVTESQRSCILCGLCVRVCEEKIGASAISLVGRGVERSVAAPFRIASEACIGCGACAAVCPVGTIVIREHPDEVEISPFKTRVKVVRCSECGARIGSALVAQALARTGGPTVVELMKERGGLCPDCRRKLVARQLGAAATS